MNWYIVKKEYIEYLHKYDEKVENIDYKEKVKPYIGIILKINNYNYYVPISSAKQKHYKMNNQIDLYKVKRKEKILGVLNINNMIPIREDCIEKLKYNEIDKHRKFKSSYEKQQYIELLEIELKLINKKQTEIMENARKLYDLVIKYPMSKLAKRSCDFKKLESLVNDYNKEK